MPDIKLSMPATKLSMLGVRLQLATVAFGTRDFHLELPTEPAPIQEPRASVPAGLTSVTYGERFASTNSRGLPIVPERLARSAGKWDRWR